MTGAPRAPSASWNARRRSRSWSRASRAPSKKSAATASRSIRSLAAPGARWSLPPHLRLIEVLGYGASRNSKTLRLTPLGVEVRDRINALIEQGVRIES